MNENIESYEVTNDVLEKIESRVCCSCKCKDGTREEMLEKIKCYNFAVIELSLYLDTHPNDERALCLHNSYNKTLKDLKDKYQKVYGPLTIYFPCNKWRWLEEPWPWEGGNF
ncbi:MAG: spore coat protein CotJB [Clostridia bacterium]|nr:spore coat protein CotJB [Clostridia bacterium]